MRTTSLLSGTAALALSALLFTACNSEDDTLPVTSSEYVTIQPSVSGEVITRAGSTYGQTGDKLYLYYNDAGNTTDGRYADFRFDGAIWDLGVKSMKWTVLHELAAGNEHSFYASAPVEAPTAANAVNTDQSAPSGYKTSDLLIAYKKIPKAAAADKYTALSLDMKHVLAKLTIEVNAKAIENAVIKSVIIRDAVTTYTTAYTASEETPAKTTVNGSDKADIKPLVNGSVYNAVLPAQAIQESNGITIVIEVGSQTFTYKPAEAINLSAGKNTTLKLRLAGTGVILGDVSVSGWGEGDVKEGNIEADQP